MKDSRCLITGGLGFVGSNLAHALCKLGAQVTIMDSCDRRFGADLTNLEGIRSNINLVYGDIRNSSDLARAIPEQDYIFQCAAYISHSESYRDASDCVAINVSGHQAVMDAMIRWAPNAVMVYPSTSSVTGPHPMDPKTEDCPCKPVEIYSASKVAAEALTMAYAVQGVKATALRFTNLYGPRAPMAAHLTFMSYFIKLALDGQPLPVFGEGNQIRNPLYIGDAISAMIEAVQNPMAHGQMFIVAGDEHYRLIDIAHTIAEIMGGPGVKHIPWPEGREDIDAGNVTISNKLCKSLIDWEPKTGLVAGLEATRAYLTKETIQ